MVTNKLIPNKMKKTTSLLAILFFLAAPLISLADDDPAPPPPPPCPSGSEPKGGSAVLGTGIGILISLAAAYGALGFFLLNRKKEEEESPAQPSE